jgi:hypothetical protein
VLQLALLVCEGSSVGFSCNRFTVCKHKLLAVPQQSQANLCASSRVLAAWEPLA